MAPSGQASTGGAGAGSGLASAAAASHANGTRSGRISISTMPDDGVARGAGIIMIDKHRNGYHFVLLGKESQYCTDIWNMFIHPDTGRPFTSKEEFKAYQTYRAPASASNAPVAARAEFSRRAHALTSRNVEFEGGIRFDTIKQNAADPSIWTTNFRFLPENFRYGIVKGGRETGETISQTIQREAREEIGIVLDPGMQIGIVPELIENYCMVFTYIDQVGPAQIANFRKYITDTIARRTAEHYGELYDLAFVSVDMIFGEPSIFLRLNAKSKQALQFIFSAFTPPESNRRFAGGVRKRRTMRKSHTRRAMRKTQKRHRKSR
jgi:8-oxo-dGTP pyrophosphatase MutT (NUDIX family)